MDGITKLSRLLPLAVVGCWRSKLPLAVVVCGWLDMNVQIRDESWMTDE